MNVLLDYFYANKIFKNVDKFAYVDIFIAFKNSNYLYVMTYINCTIVLFYFQNKPENCANIEINQRFIVCYYLLNP